MRLSLIALVALVMAAAVDHLVATAIGFVPPHATYRRIGPKSGPQVFLAGSSMLQYGLQWSAVSRSLGQGLEHWGVPGSSTEIWEQSQLEVVNSNLMIIGISAIDMNEERVAAARASIVPLSRTLADVRASGADLELSRRLLAQYPLAYVQLLFPTAGDSDAVLVGLRRLAREALGLPTAAQDQARAMILPSEPVLDFGQDTSSVVNWPKDRMLRRLEVLKSEARGKYSFNGPKQLVLRRMLARGVARGRAIVVVMPVTSYYRNDVLSPAILDDFDAALRETQRLYPTVEVVRLDRAPALRSDEYFSDFIHLNQAGRGIATQVFLQELRHDIARGGVAN